MKKTTAWVVLMVIAAAAGLLLSMTNTITLPIITASALAEADTTRSTVFSEADSFRALTVGEEDAVDNCYEALKDGAVTGHVAQITVNGFGGPIEIMAGVDSEGKLTGIQVGGADFAETAGLGARTKEPAFTDQFAEKTAPLTLGTHVDSVTGASISSGAVVDGVNALVEYVMGLD